MGWVSRQAVTNPEIIIGDNQDLGTAIALYEFGPDGTEFDPAALLTLKIDVTALTEIERASLSIIESLISPELAR